MENNKYLLAMMVAKRVKKLKAGAKPLVETKQRKPLTIALEEIKAGKVFIKEKKETLKAEQIFNEDEKPAKIEEISDEVKKPEKPEKSEDISDEDEESGKHEGLLND